MSAILSDKDAKILQVILQKIGDDPDDCKYQRLNVKNLSKILGNGALAIDLLLKLGFNYTSNQVYLTFVGIAKLIANQTHINNFLHTNKIPFILVQSALRACYRTDEDTREKFDTMSPPFGVFIVTKNNYNQNRSLSDKIQAALRAKEICNLKHFYDVFSAEFAVTSTKMENGKKLRLYVHNNNGVYFNNINWDAIDAQTLVCDFVQVWSDIVRGESNIIIKHLEQFASMLFSKTTYSKETLNFFKKCVYFLKKCCLEETARISVLSNGSNANDINPLHKSYYQLLSRLLKNKYAINNLTIRCIQQITCMCDEKREQYINTVVKSHAQRLKDSRKACKYIKRTILSKKNINNSNYVWRCLLCNTFNEYSKSNEGCPGCNWAEIYEGKLAAMSPLCCMKSDLNKSISFCVDPRKKPFYLIRDFCLKTYDTYGENMIINKYKHLQGILEKRNNLKLSIIVFGFDTMPAILILFEQSNPLTLYELKHILFEIHMLMLYGKYRAKLWTFVDVDFDYGTIINQPHRCTKNVNTKGIQFLSKLDNDNTINIMDPLYVDAMCIVIDKKVRNPVMFGKTEFDQGYYHLCYDINNVNSVKSINDIENITTIATDVKTQSNNSKQYTTKRTVKPFKVNNFTEVFHFEHAHSESIALYSRYESFKFANDRLNSMSNGLICLVKEVINNGYAKDLLPIMQNNNDETTVLSIDKIVSEYETKTNRSILNQTDLSSGKYGIFNEFNMGLIIELSKGYKIFDERIFKSRMFDKRHEMMGYPLSCCEMLALMLYCDGECNYDLCKSQRSHTVMKKWPYFHSILNYAVHQLSAFEIHYEHIYTGVCGVFFQSHNQAKVVRFQTNVSFSTDLNIALQFRGDSGMVIGMNMKRIFNHPDIASAFIACDVSWISSNDVEKEILCCVSSGIRIYPNFVRKRGDTQWIVFVEDELDENKAFKSMFGTLAD